MTQKQDRRAKIEHLPLRDIFNAFARDAVRDYPRLRDRFAILDVMGHDYYGEVDVQKSGFNDDADFASFLSRVSQASEDQKTSKAKHTASKKFLLIIFNSAMPATKDPKRDLLRTLDHELGHLVVDDAIGGYDNVAHTNFKESAADAFACLRAIKRDGADNGLIDQLAWRRAINFALRGDIAHFTTFTLEKTRMFADTIDFNDLTPNQITYLGWRLATEYALPQVALDRLEKKFKVARAKIQKGDSLESKLRVFAELLDKEKKDVNVMHAAIAFLKPYLETRYGFKGGKLNLNASELNKMRKTVADKEALVAEGILAGIPKRGYPNVHYPPKG